MASLSTNSVSSTNSLGNTSLRGFGGMVSGIDRDSIIEAMTLHASNRVTEQQKAITKLEWKQEAYQSVTDQILDLADNYLSYSSGKSLIDPSFFAKNIITVQGLEESTRFVKASGASELTENISITSVRQLATASTQESNAFHGKLQTGLNNLEDVWTSSALEGTKLVFGTVTYDNNTPRVSSDASFTFAGTYKEIYTDDNGKTQTRTVTIDYTNKDKKSDEDFYTDLAKQLNGALKDPDKNLRVGEEDISKIMEFTVARDDGGNAVGITLSKLKDSDVVINKNSTSLKALGYEKKELAEGEEDYEADGIDLGELQANQKHPFKESALNTPMAYEYMTGKKLTFNYNGSKKEIELVTKEEAEKLKALHDDSNRQSEQMKLMAENLQKRLDLAYGKNAVKVAVGADGQLTFATGKEDSTVSITSGDTALLNNLGIVNGESTKVNQSGKLTQAALKGTLGNLDDYKDADGNLDLSINGVKIKGLTVNSTVSEIMSRINNSDAGVKATYSEATGRFMLVSSETGQGREISLDSKLVQKLFGQTADGEPGTYVEKLGFKDGQNAEISVSYGGEDVLLKRSSNTFDLEGMSVTVSGVFGGKYADSVPMEGNFDVDGLTGERIFYEDPGKTKVADTLDKSKVYYDKDGQMVNYKGNRIEGNADDGYKLKYDQEWKADSAAAVTFSAAADIDGATERVKSFVEDFNKLVKEINTQVTTYPDSSYDVLTDEQKAEMSDDEIEKWEAKAKEGILYGDSAMRSLSMDVQGVMAALMSSGASYADLEKIGITYSDDYLDGGTLVFNESKFKSAMESDPELVSNIITGGGDVSKGLATIVDEAFTPYATRYASKNSDGTNKGTYGMLIEIAGTSKKPTTLYDNQIYTQLKTMNETLANLKATLKTQQERYISQFTYMESMINQFNSQSNYLSQING